MLQYLPLVAALIAVTFAAPIAFKLFFSGSKEFWECVRYSFKPDFFSWMDNELQRDYGKTLKLSIFISVLLFIGLLTSAFVDGLMN